MTFLLGSTKASYVEHILKRVATIHKNASEMNQLLKSVETKWSDDPAILHDVYRRHFNLLDLADKYWYQVQETHPNHNWKSKILFSILRFAVINSWVFYSQHQYEKWIEFRENLGKTLIQ